MPTPARVLIDRTEQLPALLEAVRAQDWVALDTESNGFHAYTEKVCLIQVATAEAEWAVDVLAVDPRPLLELLQTPARETILHAAEYDVICLKRQFGTRLGRIFDTHAAAMALGIGRVGLGNLVADQLGIQLTADEQRSDWGKRPLSTDQLDYAFADVRHLRALRDKLGAELAGRGLLAEVEAEFARLLDKEATPRVFDPDGWQRMKCARTLDGKGRAILRALYLLREEQAQQSDRPPFKVLSELFLCEVAKRKPGQEEALRSIPGASPNQLRKLSAGILSAVAQASEGPVPPPPKRGGSKPGAEGPPPPEVVERFERLRAWRKQRAEARKVEVQVIAPNAVLMAVAKAAPRDLGALAQVAGMDRFRLEQYGPEMLAALAEPPPVVPGPASQ